jgi:hypothetical protein
MASGAACTLVLLTACQSPWIACTIVNRQATPVSLVEVAYPGGSFGIQTIAPGASFHYRFHALGTETTTIDFADAAHKIHTIKGPELQLGQQGSLRIEIQPGNQVTWTPELKKAR